MQCPNCRSLQRGSALRCWKCGLDLTAPFDPAAVAAAHATATAAPAVQVVAPTPDEAEPIGPPPRPWLVRTLDPRITKAELERAASNYGRVPWIEAYRKPAGLGLLPLAALLSYTGRYLGQFMMPMIGYGPAGNDPLVYLLTFVGFLLQWSLIGTLALALFVYRGSAWAIIVSGLIWLFLLGAIALPFASPKLIRFVPILLFIACPIYVELVLLWKAWRVAVARHEYVWRQRI